MIQTTNQTRTMPSIETMDFNVRDIPRRLQQRFRAQCAMEGIPMREKIITLMRRAVNEGERKTQS